ncbi:hypothetical protein ACQ4PT_065456 [Festuca glaucescens]
MGGSQSCFGGGGRDYEEYEQPWRSARKVRPSDEDGLWYVGERDVDRKATEFIARTGESEYSQQMVERSL